MSESNDNNSALANAADEDGRIEVASSADASGEGSSPASDAEGLAASDGATEAIDPRTDEGFDDPSEAQTELLDMDASASVDERDGEALLDRADAAGQAESDRQTDVSPRAVEEPSAKKATGIGDLIAVGILAIVLGVLLCLPTALGSSSDADGADLSGGIAATVAGSPIGENDVTNYVQQFRTAQGLLDDEDWGQWMVDTGYTPESLRDTTIDYFTTVKLLKSAAEENDVNVTDEAVDEQIATIAAQLGGEDALIEALSAQGFDLEAYKENVRLGLMQQDLMAKVATGETEVSDDEVLQMLKLYYPDDVDEDAKTLDGIDEEMVSSMREMLRSSLLEQSYTTWMSDYESKAQIVKNDMPEGLPYAIDLSSFQTASEEQDGLLEIADGDEGIEAELVEPDDEGEDE